MRSKSRFRNAFLFFTLGAISGFCGPLGDKYRVLVLITEAARPYVGSEAMLTSVIREKLIDYTREAYVNSDASSTYVLPDIELAGVLRVSYTEVGGSLSSDLHNVTNHAGLLAQVGTWRNLYSADLVMLVVYGPQTGAPWGRAWLKVGQDKGYSVLNKVSYWEYYTAAHEIGHNFGCQHRVGSLNGAYSYGRGYRSVTPNTWKSIMAPYEGTGDGYVRQQWFSNPYTFVGLEARGTTSSNNCTRVLHERKTAVAGFRNAPYTLVFESVLQNGDYAHLVAGYNATLQGGTWIMPLAEAYVEADVSYLSTVENEGKLTVEAGYFAEVNGANLWGTSQTKIFSGDLANLKSYELIAGKIRVEANDEIWSGDINHYGGSGIFISHGLFQKRGNMKVLNGKIWVQAENVNLVWGQSDFKLSNNSEAQIAASGKVSFGSGTSFVNSKVRIDIGPGSTISGYPLFKPGDLNGQIETKEALAASSHFRSKVRQENDKMVLEYDLPGMSSVDVGLYLANGKLIQKRKLGIRREGTHLEVFEGISPGAVYLLHIKAGVHTATHRIIR